MITLAPGQYYGTLHSEWRFGGLIFSEYDYHAPQTDRHYHENPYFMYVLDGQVHDHSRQHHHRLGAGGMVLHNWQESHHNVRHSSRARGFHIEFPRDFFTERGIPYQLGEGSRLIGQPGAHHALARLYYEFHCRDADAALSVEAQLLELCAAVDDVPGLDGTEPSWVATLRELLRETPDDLSLAALSETLSVHPVHISRAVPRYLGMSLGNFIRQDRVRRAIGLLHDPGLSLTDVTYRCGFADQSHFTRTFRTFIGTTPGCYRKQILGRRGAG